MDMHRAITPTPADPGAAAVIPSATSRTGKLLRCWQVIQLALFVCFVCIILVVPLLVLCFGNSTQLWPVLAAAVVVVGGAVLACRSTVIQWMLVTLRLPTLLTGSAACVLLVTTIVWASDASGSMMTAPLFPYASYGIAPAHWMLVGTAGAGIALGVHAIGIDARRRSRTPLVIAALSCGVCVSYLVLWMSFLVGTFGAVDEPLPNDSVEPPCEALTIRARLAETLALQGPWSVR